MASAGNASTLGSRRAFARWRRDWRAVNRRERTGGGFRPVPPAEAFKRMGELWGFFRAEHRLPARSAAAGARSVRRFQRLVAKAFGGA